MARKNGSGFKMKSSPTKGLFSNLFKSLKAKETGDIGEKLKKKYSSEAQRAGEVAKPGESEYEFSVRKRKEKYKAKNKAKSKITPDPKPDPRTEIKGNFSTADTFKVDVPKIESTPDKKQTFKEAFASARKANKETFTWKGNSYTTELKKKEEKKPINIQIAPEEDNFGTTFRVPLTKKSPYKKGIGKYAKKAKGSRGYTMKK